MCSFPDVLCKRIKATSKILQENSSSEHEQKSKCEHKQERKQVDFSFSVVVYIDVSN